MILRDQAFLEQTTTTPEHNNSMKIRITASAAFAFLNQVQQKELLRDDQTVSSKENTKTGYITAEAYVALQKLRSTGRKVLGKRHLFIAGFFRDEITDTQYWIKVVSCGNDYTRYPCVVASLDGEGFAQAFDRVLVSFLNDFSRIVIRPVSRIKTQFEPHAP